MPRYKLTIEYDGRPFAGWQRQSDQPSVQQSLEEAAAKVNGAPVQVQGAGRTDSGVHATGQVAHLDFQKNMPAEKVMDAINYHLKPDPVAITGSELVDDEFHARFDAKERYYLYRISNRRPPLTLAFPGGWDQRLMLTSCMPLLRLWWGITTSRRFATASVRPTAR